MAVTINAIKCPSCGADLSIVEGREKMFCSFCGTPIILTNENEHIYRHIDEAGVRQAETDRIIRLKELEIEEAKYRQNSSIRGLLIKIWIGAIFAVAILCLVVWLKDVELGGLMAFYCLFYVGGPVVGGGAYLIFKVIPDKENEKHIIREGGIKFPKNLEPFDEKNYSDVEGALRRVGFTNITCINMHDLTFGWITKPGKIESISVDDEKISSGGKYYMPTVPISITYHGK